MTEVKDSKYKVGDKLYVVSNTDDTHRMEIDTLVVVKDVDVMPAYNKRVVYEVFDDVSGFSQWVYECDLSEKK